MVSGKRADRPGLKALLDDARPGDALAVVRLDRLGRSLRELLDLIETLKERGITLVSLEEKIDTASAAAGPGTTSRVVCDPRTATRAIRATATTSKWRVRPSFSGSSKP